MTITVAQRPASSYGGQGGPTSGIVSGEVKDANTDQPVAYATVTVKNSGDLSIVTGGLTEENGSFAISEIPLGDYIVEVSFIGYDSKQFGPITIAKESLRHNLEMVTLGVNAAELDAVVVEGISSAVRYEIDKKIYDADKLRAAEGGTAQDVLEQIPSITVDGNQNLQLRGSSNVRVLINGRPSSFSLETLLQQIPQKNIKEVEIITNPSAKYDAEGEAGIINIVLKENNLEGFTYGFNGQWGTENKWNGGFNAGLKTNKWNFTTSYNYNRFRDNFFRDNFTTLASLPNEVQISDQDRDFVREGNFVRLGIDHYFNKKNTLFLSGSIGPGSGVNDSFTDSDNVFTSLQNGATSFLPNDFYTFDRSNNTLSDRFGFDFSAAFQHDFSEKRDHNFLLDFNYSDSEDETSNSFLTSRIFGETSGQFQDDFTDFDNRIDDSRNIQISGDYTNPFDGKQKLELGFRTTLEDREQDFIVSFNDITDQLSSGVFNFDQDIYAAYTTYQNQISEKVGVKGGLRAEYTDVFSVSDGGQNLTYDDEFLSLFPSGSASFKANENTQLSASYSRRISRPRGRQLNPFADRSDPNNQFVGNNALRPEFTNSYEIGINQNIGSAVNLDGAVYHRFVTDHIRFFRTFSEEVNTNIVSFRNIAELSALGVETSLSINPENASWMNLIVSGNYNYQNVTNVGSDDQILNPETTIFSGRIMQNLNFQKGWGGQLSANYQAPFEYFQGNLDARYGINLNINKSGLLNDRASVYVNARDIFNTNNLDLDFQDDFRSQVTSLDWPSQMLFVGFNMNFGELKSPAKRKAQRREERQGDQPVVGGGGR